MNTFKIVIPSKNRINVFKNNCLKFLIDTNLIKNEIYLFVDSLDIKSYKKEFDNKYNIKVIEGKTGLINQRNFIKDYFPEDTLLLHLDDDLKGVNYTGNIDLNLLISQDFRHMLDKNITLGSINPTNNSYFKRNKYLYGLYLCVGCYYYEINKKDKNLYLSNLFESEKEDYLRTLEHYKYRGLVYRNDYLNVIHKYNKNDDGGMNGNRLDNNNDCCNYINKKYPNFTKIFLKNGGEKKEIKLRSNKHLFKKLHLDMKINSELGKYFEIDNTYIHLDKNKNYELYDKSTKELLGILIRNVLPNPDVINYDLLNKITRHGTCNRSNIAGPIEINKLDISNEKKEKLKLSDLVFINNEKTRARHKDKKFQFCNKFQSNNLGYFRLRKVVKLSTESKKYDNEFKEDFYQFVKTVDNWSKLYYPENHIPVVGYCNSGFTGITINNTTRAGNHIDGNNKGFCSLIVLGEFKGCELLFTDYKLNCNINPNKDILLFNSTKIKHCNNSYLGKENKRYSMVFFKNRRLFLKE